MSFWVYLSLPWLMVLWVGAVMVDLGLGNAGLRASRSLSATMRDLGCCVVEVLNQAFT
jgi:hypothetical protein